MKPITLDSSSGSTGGADFFLLHLVDDASDSDRPGPATFGLLVDDLNQSHAQALAAGASEMTPPHDAQGCLAAPASRTQAGTGSGSTRADDTTLPPLGIPQGLPRGANAPELPELAPLDNQSNGRQTIGGPSDLPVNGSPSQLGGRLDRCRLFFGDPVRPEAARAGGAVSAG
jgi:hypothetical protein